MDTAEARADRLQRAMAGRTQAWLGKAVGVATSSINGYLRGIIPQADVCIKICDALAIDIRWYLYGETPKDDLGTGEVVLQIPILDHPDSALPFPESHISTFGHPYESFCVHVIGGTLMAPTLPKGSELLATRNFSGVEDGKIYIVQNGGRHTVRRLFVKSDGSINGLCDNPAIQNEHIDEYSADQIVALVLWASHAP
jgi:hypothetical protein